MFGGSAFLKHRIKRVDRLIGNRHLAQERGIVYQAMLRVALRWVTRPLILIDWTDLAVLDPRLVVGVTELAAALAEQHPKRAPSVLVDSARPTAVELHRSHRVGRAAALTLDRCEALL